MHIKITKTSVAVLSFFALLSTAEAQSTLPRSVSYSQADDQSLNDADTIQSYFHRGRSYECSLQLRDFANAGDEFYIFNQTVMDPDGTPLIALPNGDDYPAIAPVDGVEAVQSLTRLSLTAQKTGIYKFTVEDAFGVGNDEAHTIRCRETTLYGGYNRFFAGVAIAEVNNAAPRDFDVFVTVVTSEGVTVVDKQKYTAKAETRSDLIFANLPQESFGQVRITHSAPYGALSGIVAEYDFLGDGSIVLKRERPLKSAERR